MPYLDHAELSDSDIATFESTLTLHESQGHSSLMLTDFQFPSSSWEMILTNKSWNADGTWQSTAAVFRPPLPDNELTSSDTRYVRMSFDSTGKALPDAPVKTTRAPATIGIALLPGPARAGDPSQPDRPRERAKAARAGSTTADPGPGNDGPPAVRPDATASLRRGR